MDNNKKLFEELLKADGIDPTGPTEAERISFRKMLDQQLKTKKSTPVRRPDICRIIMKSKITKLAAAAVIIIGVSLFLVQEEQPRETETQQITQTEKSPAELTTFASFHFAYHQGGMEMVKQICDKALKMAGQRPANISMKEFSEGINNQKSERTEL